jgi:hypothetical protein
MKHWWIAATVAALALSGAWAVKTHASENNSQLFTPARYALVAAEVDVALLQGAGSAGKGHSRQAVFKLDSLTGEVWVLQMEIMGGNDPKVTNANWHPVQHPKRQNPDADPAFQM